MNNTENNFLWFLRITLPFLVIGGSVMLYRIMMGSAPEQEKKPPQERKVFVEVSRMQLQDKVVQLRATGTVVPVDRVVLKARVSGAVIEVNDQFEPGKIIRQGESIVRIDSTDYLLAERVLSSALVQAEYDYKVELGYQEVARHEWEMIDIKKDATELEEELTLRKPHLKRVKAKVEAAKANLEQARVNLKRVEVSLPFDALVIKRDISLGTQINTQSELGVLVDASTFRVEVTVPFDQLDWIKLPSGNNPGASVNIYPSGGSNGSALWQGTVSGLSPEIESRGRMVQLLIKVENPMEAEVPLLLNSFVSVEIASRKLENIFVVPAKAVHNGEIVYLMNSESRLAFKKIVTIWRDEEWVVATTGLEPGDMLITSDVPSAVPDMRVEEVRSQETGGRSQVSGVKG